MTFSFAPNDEPLYVSEGDYVQFKFKAPSSWDTTQTVTLQIGDLTSILVDYYDQGGFYS